MTAEPINPFSAPNWILDDGKLGKGKSGRIDASAAECAAAAKALDLLECRKLSLSYTLKAMPVAGFRMRAEVTAEVVQACVITTEPVVSTTREEVDVDLLPASVAPPVAGEVSFDPLNDSDCESYADGKIDLGQYAFELFSTSIDPYPRKPGSELAEPSADDRAKLSPFAVLGKLKGK